MNSRNLLVLKFRFQFCLLLDQLRIRKNILLYLYLFFAQFSFFVHVETILSFKHLTYIIFCLCWRRKLRSLSHVQLFATSQTVVRGIHQARILEWVAYSFSSESPWFRSLTRVSFIAGRFFTNWAMKEAPSSMLRISINISCRQVWWQWIPLVFIYLVMSEKSLFLSLWRILDGEF